MPFSRLGYQLALTIAGGVHVAAVLLFGLWMVGDSRLFPATLERDLLPYLALGLAAISYVSGVVAYEAVIISLRPIALFAEKRFAWPGLRVARNIIPGAPAESEIIVWQCGSDRLTRELDGLVANLWLIRLLLVGLPALALSFYLWCRAGGFVREGNVAAVGLLLCTAVLILGHRNQVRRMQAFLDSARSIIAANKARQSKDDAA